MSKTVHTAIAERKAALAQVPVAQNQRLAGLAEPTLLGRKYTARKYDINSNNTVAFSVFCSPSQSQKEKDERKMYQRLYFRDFVRSGDDEGDKKWTFKLEQKTDGSSGDRCMFAEFEVYYCGYTFEMIGVPDISPQHRLTFLTNHS